MHEPAGMPNCCPDTLLQRLCASRARVLICCVGTPSATSESTLEMVQRRSARRILHDFSPTSSASALVAQLQRDNLQSRSTSDKVCMMYNIMNCLVEVNPAAGLLQPRSHSCRGHKYQLQVSHSRTDMYLHSYFPSPI